MRAAYAISAIAVLLAPFGCASILGDFSDSPSPSGNDGGPTQSDGSTSGTDGTVTPDSGGGSDSSSGDTATPLDSPVDTGPPLSLLSCNAWQNANPIVVLDVAPFDSGSSGNGNSPIQQIIVEHLPDQSAARIVASTNLPGGSGFEVFTVGESGGVTTLPFSNVGFRAETKTSAATALLVQNFVNNGYEYYAIPDTNPGTDAGAPVAMIGQPPNNGNGGVNASFAQASPGVYYALVSYSSTSAGEYNVASWLSSGSTWTSLLANQPELNLGSGALLIDGTNAFGFLAALGSGGGAPQALFEDTLTISGTTFVSRQVTADGGAASTIAVSGPSGGPYNLAFVELGGAQSADLRVGPVTETAINTFMVDDLPVLFFKPGGDAGFFDTTPFQGGNGPGGRWLSNGELGIMGGGGTGSGGPYTGINFYVGTPDGQWIIETAGSGQNLFVGQTITETAFDLSQAVGQLVLNFDVAWVQTLATGHTVLYFNVLDCSLP